MPAISVNGGNATLSKASVNAKAITTDDLVQANLRVNSTKISEGVARVNGQDPSTVWKLPAVDSQQTMAAYWKMDEGSGTTAADATGNGNTGTLTFGSGGAVPAWVTDLTISGNALQFTGTDKSKVRCGTGLRPVTSSYTIGCVVKPLDLASVAGRFHVLANDNVSGSGPYMTINYTNLGNLNQIANGVSNTNIITSHATMGWDVDNFWNFVWVFDDTNNLQRVHINGVEIASIATTHTLAFPGTGEFVIGMASNPANEDNANHALDGIVHWMAVWETALTAVEVTNLYNEIKP